MINRFFAYVPERLRQSWIVLVHDTNDVSTQSAIMSALIRSKADAYGVIL